jgi:triphosphoribosyl-dephospho-CoA synthase
MIVQEAFVACCRQELSALKPGNVHVHAAGHGMTVDDFLRSAAAAAPALCREGARLGTRILDAVTATRASVGQNTNLGIVLLCAPLAMAAQTGQRVARVLAQADVDDTYSIFHAIALARPAGLGSAARHDVLQPARVTPVVAMREAASRDSIARQWATDYSDVRELMAHCAAPVQSDPDWATTALYLHILARWPDSHVARKHGVDAARRVQAQAAPLADAVAREQPTAALRRSLEAFDATLKRAGLNPGTSADLTVATLFAIRLRSAYGGTFKE